MGVDLERSQTAVSLAHRFDPVWAGVGHHPTESAPPDLQALRALAEDLRVVAVGEVGLDFEHKPSPPAGLQVERLHQVFELAVDLDLPVSIHNRGAAAELSDAIASHRGLRGVMHYFALEWDWALR